MFSLAAQAQTTPKYIEVPFTLQCTNTPDLINELQNNFKEVPTMVGVAGELLMIIWKEVQSGSFSVTLSSKDGSMSCMVLTGTKLRNASDKGL
jgi:hypothetical protein